MGTRSNAKGLFVIGPDYMELCRLCLKRTNLKINIFQDEGLIREINQKILNCISLIVSADDYLPKFVCHTCVDKLGTFQEFRSKCHESENLLNRYISDSSNPYENSPMANEQTSWNTAGSAVSERKQSASDIFEPETVLYEPTIKVEKDDDVAPAESTTCDGNVWKSEPTLSVNEIKCEVESSCDKDTIHKQSNVASISSQTTDVSLPTEAVNGDQSFCRSSYDDDDDDDDSDIDVKVVSVDVSEYSDCLENPEGTSGPSAQVDVSGSSPTGPRSLKKDGQKKEVAGNLMNYTFEALKDCLMGNEHFLKMEPPENSPNENQQYPQPYDHSVFNKETPPMQGKPYRCIHCPKCFRNKYKLDRHLRIHTGERPYECKLCNLKFTRNEHLKRHIVIHTGEKPYVCDFCNKSFSRKGNLDDHRRIHTGERPHVCSVCFKGFSYKYSLLEHFRIHTGEKPFQCTVCDKRFTYKNALHSHMKTHSVVLGHLDPVESRACP